MAAKLDVPVLIVLNRRHRQDARKFEDLESGLGVDNFHYPQHSFVSSSSLYADTFEESAFARVVDEWLSAGSCQGQSPGMWAR